MNRDPLESKSERFNPSCPPIPLTRLVPSSRKVKQQSREPRPGYVPFFQRNEWTSGQRSVANRKVSSAPPPPPTHSKKGGLTKRSLPECRDTCSSNALANSSPTCYRDLFSDKQQPQHQQRGKLVCNNNNNNISKYELKWMNEVP